MKQKKIEWFTYIALLALLFNMLCLPLAGTATAEDQVPSVVVNGQTLVLDVAPLIENYRILVPVRAICEALGAEVAWNGEQQMVSAVRAGSTVSFVLGQTQAQKDGQVIEMDVVPVVASERVLVPLRFISEAFGAQVEWNAETYTAIVNLADATVPISEPLSETQAYNQAGTYGPESGQEILDANALVAVDGVTLQNMLIKGDLIIDSSVEEGSFTLNNVEVEGTVYVRGGGPNSVAFNNSTLDNVIVEKNGVRIVSTGSTSVTTVTLENGATLVEISGSNGAGFQQIIINSGAQISLQGNFTSVNINSPASAVQLVSGTVQNMTVGPAATGIQLNLAEPAVVNSLTLNGVCSVLGTGQITQATVNALGCSFQTMPASLANNTNQPLTAVPVETSSITVSNFETNNQFGGFKFTTSQAVTAEELAGKILAGSIAATSIEQRGAINGKEWKGVFNGIQADKSYAITCLTPFALSSSTSLTWDLTAPAVTSLSAYYDGMINVSFNKADGENQQVSEYRVFVVKSTSSLTLNSANSASSSNYTTVDATNSSSYNEWIAIGSKDSDGATIAVGNSYRIYVLTVADGTNATTNYLTGPSSTVSTGALASEGDAEDETAPEFAATYPNMSGVTHRQADINARIDEAGTLFYVVLANGAAAPTAQQVADGQDSTGAAALFSGSRALAANTAAAKTITGLTASTDYDIYAVARDGSNNLQEAPVLLEITTTATPPAASVSKAEFTSDGNISITFDKSIDTSNLPNVAGMQDAFTITSTATITVTSVQSTATASKIKLIISTPGSGTGYKVTYNKPGDTAIQLFDTDGVAVPTFTNKNVDIPSPATLSSAQVSTATTVLLTFSKKVDASNMANMASYFSVTIAPATDSDVLSVTQPDSSVASYEKKVILTLATPISSGDTVTVDYTKPGAANASDRLRNLEDTTLAVATFTSAVTNSL